MEHLIYLMRLDFDHYTWHQPLDLILLCGIPITFPLFAIINSILVIMYLLIFPLLLFIQFLKQMLRVLQFPMYIRL